MDRFYKKKVLLAPFSPMSKAFKHFLVQEQKVNFIGFIDKNAQGNDIYQYGEVSSLEYDAILVLSPNHAKSIMSTLIKEGSPRASCFEVHIHSNEYGIAEQSHFRQLILPLLNQSVQQLFYSFIQLLYFLTPIKRKKILFISKDFIGANNKFLYLHCWRNKFNTMMLSDNKTQVNELKDNGLPVAGFESLATYYHLATAKVIIFDQGNYTYLPKLSREQKTVQLWHGVGLKKMSKLDNITYDYFVSTSDWTNESNFKHIFSARHFVNCGYPRNDILFEKVEVLTKDNLDLLFTDSDIFHFVKKKQKNSTILLYMPTHREKSVKLPLNFKKLNQQLIELNAYLIVKLHPFVLQFYKELEADQYSQIKVYDPQADIYPVLNYCDVLISDYSSIVYDFLLLERPIIFFNYDNDVYIENYGDFLFDYDEYSPGIKVENQEQLINAVKTIGNETYVLQRNTIKKLFYDQCDQNASARIMDLFND